MATHGDFLMATDRHGRVTRRHKAPTLAGLSYNGRYQHAKTHGHADLAGLRNWHSAPTRSLRIHTGCCQWRAAGLRGGLAGGFRDLGSKS
jgi:hypothetical protein